MRSLRFGSTGPAVELLQLGLNRAGFGPLELDGVFGPATRGAVSRFQAVNRLHPDGIAGPATQQAMLPWYTGYVSVRVRPGDTIWSLARLYGSSTEAVLLANPGVRPEELQIGSALILPLPFPVVPEAIRFSSALVGYCVQGLGARYPFLHVASVGKSVLGKPLWSLRLGRGENRVLYHAEHHANEWITTPLLLRFAEELAAAAAAGEELAGIPAGEILDYAELCLVPAVNPDGLDLVTGELNAGEAFRQARAMAERYPRYPFPAGWKANLRGVDLNLQYPAMWEQARQIKFAQGYDRPAPRDFVGAGPLTAPESRALADFTRALDPDLILAYHTQGGVIYWRYLDAEPEGARELGLRLAAVSGYALEDAPYASGFAGYKDWFIDAFGRPGYTVEAGLGENPLPVGQFDAIWRANAPLLTAAALG